MDALKVDLLEIAERGILEYNKGTCKKYMEYNKGTCVRNLTSEFVHAEIQRKACFFFLNAECTVILTSVCITITWSVY